MDHSIALKNIIDLYNSQKEFLKKSFERKEELQEAWEEETSHLVDPTIVETASINKLMRFNYDTVNEFNENMECWTKWNEELKESSSLYETDYAEAIAIFLEEAKKADTINQLIAAYLKLGNYLMKESSQDYDNRLLVLSIEETIKKAKKLK